MKHVRLSGWVNGPDYTVVRTPNVERFAGETLRLDRTYRSMYRCVLRRLSRFGLVDCKNQFSASSRSFPSKCSVNTTI